MIDVIANTEALLDHLPPNRVRKQIIPANSRCSLPERFDEFFAEAAVRRRKSRPDSWINC